MSSIRRLRRAGAQRALIKAYGGKRLFLRSWSPLAYMNSVLTPRLRQCLALARDGKTAIQIADALDLSHRTVNQYLSDAYKRLGARNRAQAVYLAIERGEI